MMHPHKAWLRPQLLVTLAVALSFIAGSAQAQGSLSLPNWTDVFNPGGSVKDTLNASGATGGNGIPDYVDLYGAIDAVFAGDNISNAIATDMSLHDGNSYSPIAHAVVSNGTVSAAHDVGNGFVMAKIDAAGDLILYGGVERLAPANENSYVEFEFNQQVVQAIGVDVALRGERTTGDLLIRLQLVQGSLAAADVQQWTGTSQFQPVAPVTIVSGFECSGDPQNLLVCDPWLASGQHNYQSDFLPWSEGWDLSGNPVSVPSPNALLQFGINVGQVLGFSPDYTSIVVRTPEDIILDGFRNTGHWAQFSATTN